LLERSGHAGAGLSGADDGDPTNAIQIDRRFAGDVQPMLLDSHRRRRQPLGSHGLEPGLPDSPGVVAQLGSGSRHNQLSLAA
jgi:hypothetical protein